MAFNLFVILQTFRSRSHKKTHRARLAPLRQLKPRNWARQTCVRNPKALWNSRNSPRSDASLQTTSGRPHKPSRQMPRCDARVCDSHRTVQLDALVKAAAGDAAASAKEAKDVKAAKPGKKEAKADGKKKVVFAVLLVVHLMFLCVS